MRAQRFAADCGRLIAAASTIVALTAGQAFASDGAYEINQARVAAAGGFPFTISQGGRWILTGNLVVPSANTTAIRIATDDVTLDLGGFTIRGPGGAGSGEGVVLAPNNGTIGPVTVRNGIVRGMGDHGVDLVGNQVRVEDLMITENGGLGIQIGDGLVSRNLVKSNGGDGILCGASCVVRDNHVSLSGGDGIRGVGLAEGNHASNNQGDGIDWAPRGLVIGNTSLNNTLVGIRLGAAVGYQNDVASGNAGGQVVGGTNMGNNVP